MGAPSRAPQSRTARLVRLSTLSYLGVMVILPLVALMIQAAEPGSLAFWKAAAVMCIRR